MERIDYETHEFKNKQLPFTLQRVHMHTNNQAKNIYINWHSNIEIYYCIDGEGQILSGAKLINVKKGNIVVINSNLFHDIITHSSIECYFLIIDNEFCRSHGINPEEILFEDFIDDETTKAAFLAINDAYKSNEDLQIPEVHYAVLGLMLNLYKYHTKSIHAVISVDNNAERIKDIITYIKLHFTEKLSLDKIAQENNISKSYLVHEFKRYTGKTVVEYINDLRCLNAQSLIKNGISVSTAGLSSGFDNLSYFSRTYKKYMSSLPSKEKH